MPNDDDEGIPASSLIVAYVARLYMKDDDCT